MQGLVIGRAMKIESGKWVVVVCQVRVDHDDATAAAIASAPLPPVTPAAAPTSPTGAAKPTPADGASPPSAGNASSSHPAVHRVTTHSIVIPGGGSSGDGKG